MIDTQPLNSPPKGPINIASKEVNQNKYAYYEWLRDNDPVHKGNILFLKCTFLSQYDDCVSLLKDKRFVRDRRHATGKGGVKAIFRINKAKAIGTK